MAIGDNSLFVTPAPEGLQVRESPGANKQFTGKRRAETAPTTERDIALESPEGKRARLSGALTGRTARPSVEGGTEVTWKPSTGSQDTRREVIIIEDSPSPSQSQLGPEDVAIVKTNGAKMVHLKNIDLWVREDEEYQILQRKFCATMQTAKKLAMPSSDAKQRLEEICTDVMAKPASYLVKTYAKSWKHVLNRVRAGLKLEEKQIEGFFEAVRRPSTERALERTLDVRTKAVADYKEADDLRYKIVEDLKLVKGAGA